MRRRFSMGLGVFLLAVGLALPGAARAGDAMLFADLIPGEPLADSELGDLHGRGFSTSSSSGASVLSAGNGFESIALRKLLSESMRSVGLRAPLVPSAGIESGPRLAGSLGAVRISSPSMPRIELPTLPRLPNPSAGSGGGSFFSSNR